MIKESVLVTYRITNLIRISLILQEARRSPITVVVETMVASTLREQVPS